MPKTPLPADIGEVIGQYRLDAVLGRGGMGCVYRGTHQILGRKAAIKVLSHKYMDEDSVERFFREAKVVNAARHPNVVDIWDFVHTQDPPRIAYVMEYLEGASLASVLRKTRPPRERSFSIIRQLSLALAAIHEKGVIHRDLKPGNIMVLSPLEQWKIDPKIKLLDFGIAKVIEGSQPDPTHPGLMLGTPAYMAPEQIAGKEISPAADIYALAEILYELVFAERPFSGEPQDILRDKLNGLLPQPQNGVTYPDQEALLALIHQCLQKDSSARPSIPSFMLQLEALDPDLELSAGSIDLPSPRSAQQAITLATLPPPTTAPPLDTISTVRPEWMKKAGLSMLMSAVLIGAYAFTRAYREAQPVAAELVLPKKPAPAPAKAAQVAAKPKPAPAKPFLVQVISEPSGAEVRRVRDNSLVGYTPLQLSLPKGERWQLEAKFPGHVPSRTTIDTSAQKVKMSLSKRARPRKVVAPPPPQPTPQATKPSPGPIKRTDLPEW